MLSLLDYCNAVLVGHTGTTADSPARGGETRARPETTRPCNSRLSGYALASCRATNRILIVSPRAQGPDWSAPDYITNLLTLVTNIPSRSSLRASSNGDLFQPRTERRIGDREFSVVTPRAWNRLPTELKLMRSSTATFRHHLKSCFSHGIL